MDHRPHHRARRRHHAIPLDPARSPWITSSTMSPRTAGTTRWSPHRKGRSCRCRSHPTMSGIPTMRSSVSPCVGGSPLQPAFYRFTTRSALRLRLRPLRTPRHRDALGISYRTSTTKAREGLTPPCPTRLPGVRQSEGAAAATPSDRRSGRGRVVTSSPQACEQRPSSWPAPSSPQPSWPAPSWQRPSWPAPSWQVPSWPAPSWQRPSWPAPSWRLPSSWPAPSSQVPSWQRPSSSQVPSWRAPSWRLPSSWPGPSWRRLSSGRGLLGGRLLGGRLLRRCHQSVTSRSGWTSASSWR